MVEKTVMVQVAIKVEPTTWTVTAHDGRVIGRIELDAPDHCYANCYSGAVKKGKPVEVWSGGFDTLDLAVEQIVLEHYPKLAA